MRRSVVLAVLALLPLVAWVAPVSAAPEEESDDAFLARTLEEAKALAAKLPAAKELGEGWREPWEVPANLRPVPNEEAWWQKFGQRTPPAGMSAEKAQAIADSVAQQIATQGASEGFTERDGLITLLMMLRAHTTTALQKAEDGADALMRLANAPAGGLAPPPGQGEHAAAAHRAIWASLAGRYQGQDAAALRASFVSEATRIVKRTKREYFLSNNWEALAKVAYEKEIAERQLTFGSAQVVMMLVDADRVGELADLEEAAVAATQKRLTEAYLAMSRLAAKAAGPDAKPAAPLTVEVKRRDFGDNAYVIRVVGQAPDVPGLTVSVLTGWLRNGRAAVEITFTGTLSEEARNAALDGLLQKADGVTNLYRE